MAPVDTVALGECVQEAAGDDVAGGETPQAAAAREHTDRLTQQRVLDRLWFRRIHDRSAALSPPNPGTFEWLLTEGAIGSRWHDLPAWLRGDANSLYWVCGKAGSGKSTLMKFVVSHIKTRAFLESWASGCELHIASFFFYHLGTEEQKSQKGLFQALLHDILKAKPELIAEILPDMWREARVSKKTATLPTQAEMKHAFQLLAKPVLQSHKYCLIIDGLDEFSGRAMDAVEVIQTFSSLTNFKVIVSSRPIPSCAQAFSSCSRLNLEDLTRNDMMKYIDQRLTSHSYLLVLQRQNTEFAYQLKTELVRKASGVFLWLMVVCRSLLEGFNNCDDLASLQRRIDELPEELELLFEHMLRKLAPTYGHYAFRILGILRLHHATMQLDNEDQELIEAVELALADSHDLDVTNMAGVHPRNVMDDYTRCVVLRNRLRARCCGLVELQYNERLPPDGCGHLCSDPEDYPHDAFQDREACSKDTTTITCAICALETSEVQFIHRSLLEFMDTSSFALLQDHINCDGLHFEAALDLACVYTHKLFVLEEHRHNDQDLLPASFYIEYLLSCIESVSSTAVGQLSLLLDEVLAFLDTWKQRRSEDDLGSDRLLPGKAPRSDLKLALSAEINRQDLFEIIWKDAGQPSLRNLTVGWPILYRAVDRPLLKTMTEDLDWDDIPNDPCPDFAKALMQAGCDPNRMTAEITPWLEMLEKITHWLQRSSRRDWQICFEFAERFLDFGASIQDARDSISFAEQPPDMATTICENWDQIFQLVERYEAQEARIVLATASPLPVDTADFSEEVSSSGRKQKRHRSSSESSSRNAEKRIKTQVWSTRGSDSTLGMHTVPTHGEGTAVPPRHTVVDLTHSTHPSSYIQRPTSFAMASPSSGASTGAPFEGRLPATTQYAPPFHTQGLIQLPSLATLVPATDYQSNPNMFSGGHGNTVHENRGQDVYWQRQLPPPAQLEPMGGGIRPATWYNSPPHEYSTPQPQGHFRGSTPWTQ